MIEGLLGLGTLVAAEAAPGILSVSPMPGQVRALTRVKVVFSQPVSGVHASDLLVGGQPAVAVTAIGNGESYLFTLERPPAYGQVQISWDPSQTIFDLGTPPERFDANGPGAVWAYDFLDTTAPVVSTLNPAAGVTVRALTQIEVIFSEPVVGVAAEDLLINGQPASTVTIGANGEYLFQFASPLPGSVGVSWADDHGIRDFASPPNPLAGASWTYTLDPHFQQPSVRINEFLTSNIQGLTDEDKDHEDWIELYNYGTKTVDLTGLALTDDAADADRWVFPAATLEAGRYLVVFASGKDRRHPTGTNAFHTNFKLNPAGEYLGLFSAESPRVALSEVAPAYPEQRNDYSYGYLNDTLLRYFSRPTPGAVNTLEEAGNMASPPHFSVERGFFDKPFWLFLHSVLPGVSIRYTTDGSEPTGNTGLEYTGAVQVASTTLIRAATFRPDLLPSSTVTHTYLFLDQVLRQPKDPAGFPVGETVMGGYPADYEMDPEIVTNALYRSSMKDALRALPVLSLVGSFNDLFGPLTGIYTHPTSRGPSWEKPCSVELILTNGASGFQVNAGLQIQGNASRDPQKQPKHPFRVVFKGDYGPARLHYPFFPDSPVDSFDTLVLRADYNFSWLHWSPEQRSRGQRTRDAWMKDSLRAMGGLATHNRFVHLYLNGLYWGIYDPSERPDAAFAASYLGGEKEEYDTVNEPNTNGSQAIDGDLKAYYGMLGVPSPAEIARYNQIQQYLDVTQFIDYMLLHFYAGHEDWGNDKNWYAVRRRQPGAGFKYLPWDGENILGSDVSLNRVSNQDVPSGLHTKLMASTQYRLDFADRVQKHFFEGGALTPESVAARWMSRAAEVDLAILAESARWGDYRRDVHPYSSGPYELYTRNQHWLAEQHRLLQDYFPRRTTIVLAQLRAAGLYPTLAAPLLSQRGGRVAPGFTLSLTATNVIYYTTNGTDPRVYGSGAVSPVAQVYADPIILRQTTAVRARAWSGGRWSALSGADFTVGRLDVPLRISEIMYHPPGGDAYEFLELQNVGPTTLNIGSYRVTGIDFAFAPNTLLPSGGVLVLGSDASPGNWTNRYPGVAVAGRFSGNLSNGGERVSLQDETGRTFWSVAYADRGGWPVAADGEGASLELIDPWADPDDPANWRASSVVNGTPGRISPLWPAGDVVLNEVLADNVSAVVNAGSHPDWVELYNRGANPVSLAGWSLTDDGDSRKFVFPPETALAPGGYLMVWCDGVTNSGAGLHSGFALNRGGESLFLFDASTKRVDAITFGRQLPDLSVGRVDGNWVLTLPTPRAANQRAPLADSTNLVINEWLANPEPGGEDWIELHNRSVLAPVALSGLYLGTSNDTVRIGSLSFVSAGGFVQCWADGKTGPVHLNFKLPPAGGTILFHDETGTLLDQVTYGPQASGVSQGRWPDDSSTVVSFPGSASPGASNYVTPYTGPFLNEVLAINHSAATNALGRSVPWVELFNPGADALNLAGWGLSTEASGEARWVFPIGSILPSGGYQLVWFDDERPVSAQAEPVLNAGFRVEPMSGGVYLFDRGGRRVDAVEYGFQVADVSIGVQAGQWRLLAEPTPGRANASASPLGSPVSLRFNEWMAHPAQGQGPDWFELYNSATRPVELSGLYLTDHPSSTALRQFQVPALSFIGAAGFVRWIADEHPARGRDHVNFSLDAEGEVLRLSDAAGGEIETVYFDAQSEGTSQGRLPDGADRIVSFSATPTPGESNYLPIETVEINEILPRPVAPFENALELFNPSAIAVDLGGWYLSDTASELRKFVIPPATVLAPSGFLMFYGNQLTGGLSSAVPLRWDGLREGAVFLSQADGVGNLTGYRAQVRFGPGERDVSLGRAASSVGPVFVPLSQRTFGADNPRSTLEFRFGAGRLNASPKVGPIVLNEVMYHAAAVGGGEDTRSGYIELYNLTSRPVLLGDPLHPTHTWRLRGGVQFNFPGSASMASHSYLLVVGFDPLADPGALLAFRSKYHLPASVLVLGPFQGQLGNGGETLDLLRPDEPPAPGSTEGYPNYFVVDRLRYGAVLPWPLEADGGGASLQRRRPGAFGNDPVNWKAEAPNPGRANTVGSTFRDQDADGISDEWEEAHGLNPGDLLDATADPDGDGLDNETEYHDGTDPRSAQSLTLTPLIGLQPASQVVPVGRNVTFFVGALGTPPVRYQWWFNGRPLPGELSARLGVTNAQPAEAGDYTVVVMNGGGFALSQPAHLTVKLPPRILRQPQSLVVTNGTNVSFSVEASGSSPLRYQWRRNGVELPGETAPVLTLTNVQMVHSGIYGVAVGDGFASLISYPAILTVMAPPRIVQHPRGQTVLAGRSVTFRVMADGSLPMGFRWRGPSPFLIPFSQGRSSFTLTNVQPINSGIYSVVITNIVNTFPGVVSEGAVLTVLADEDGDGMADDWEIALGLDPHAAEDALLDPDGDGVSNRDEYLAGTDPRDPLSVLRIDRLLREDGQVQIEFRAVSNRTYSLQFKNSLAGGAWSKWVDVEARPTNRLERIVDRLAPPFSRFYRLLLP